jgi:hypothetical protein
MCSGISTVLVVRFRPTGNSQTEGDFSGTLPRYNINGGIHDSEFISGTKLSFQSNPIVVPEA